MFILLYWTNRCISEFFLQETNCPRVCVSDKKEFLAKISSSLKSYNWFGRWLFRADIDFRRRNTLVDFFVLFLIVVVPTRQKLVGMSESGMIEQFGSTFCRKILTNCGLKRPGGASEMRLIRSVKTQCHVFFHENFSDLFLTLNVRSLAALHMTQADFNIGNLRWLPGAVGWELMGKEFSGSLKIVCFKPRKMNLWIEKLRFPKIWPGGSEILRPVYYLTSQNIFLDPEGTMAVWSDDLALPTVDVGIWNSLAPGEDLTKIHALCTSSTIFKPIFPPEQ